MAGAKEILKEWLIIGPLNIICGSFTEKYRAEEYTERLNHFTRGHAVISLAEYRAKCQKRTSIL